jgi:hypothetical protein
MPERADDLPIHTTQHVTFALPGAVARGIAYLSDPTVVLSALPSAERVIHRQNGAFRVTLAPVQIAGLSLRPAAEIMFAAAQDRVTIRSIPEEPHALQPDEVAARITGLFVLAVARRGCTVRASLKIDADVPARTLPSFMPRVIAHRTAETVLMLRMKQEIAAMSRTLVRGYPAWDAEGAQAEIPDIRPPAELE